MVIKEKNSRLAAGELLSLAIIDTFPQAKLLGFALTDLGFAIEFIVDVPLDETSLPLLEENMRILMKRGVTLEPISMMRENAADLFTHQQQPFLAESILQNNFKVVSLTRCENSYGATPLLEEADSKDLGVPKLLEFSSYQLTLQTGKVAKIFKIEGVICQNTKKLKQFLKLYEENKKNDHVKLGLELDLFYQPKPAFPGCWSWLPRGELVKNILIDWWKTLYANSNFQLISTSKWLNPNGQQDKRVSCNEYQISCLSDRTPLYIDMYVRLGQSPPLRLAEIYEHFNPAPQDAQLGLLRTSLSTRDAAIALITLEDVENELISSLQFLEKSINMFPIDYKWYLTFSKSNTTKNQGSHDREVRMLKKALNTVGFPFHEDTESSALKKPLIEARFIDSLGREWKGPSLQISRTDSSCDLRDSKGQPPILLKRALFGSIERMLALLIECTGGLLPLWLAPEQVRIIPVREADRPYAREVAAELQQSGFRTGLDTSLGKLAERMFAVKKIRVPYAVVVGEHETQNGSVAVCPWNDRNERRQEKLSAFIDRLQIEKQSPFPFKRGTKVELNTD